LAWKDITIVFLKGCYRIACAKARAIVTHPLSLNPGPSSLAHAITPE
jgi:hypothetical protein